MRGNSWKRVYIVLCVVMTAACQSSCVNGTREVEGVTSIYTVCKSAEATSVATSRAVCEKDDPGSHLVTFQSQEEFMFVQNLIISTLANATETFRYIPGFHQKNSFSIICPMTGSYYWEDDMYSFVTNGSSTYWQLFDAVITKFTEQNESVRLSANFVLNSRGEWFPGESLKGGKSVTDVDGVVCEKNIFPVTEEPAVVFYLPAATRLNTTTTTTTAEKPISDAIRNTSVYPVLSSARYHTATALLATTALFMATASCLV